MTYKRKKIADSRIVWYFSNSWILNSSAISLSTANVCDLADLVFTHLIGCNYGKTKSNMFFSLQICLWITYFFQRKSV